MRLYITGGTGFVGSNIVKVAIERRQAEVFTTVHTWQSDGAVPFAYAPVNMLERTEVLASVERFQPDAIIHSAILNNFDLMYRDRVLGWRSYVEATRTMTEAANRVGAKLVLISTDWVFDGSQSGADEATPPNPRNYYGVLKAVCETVVQDCAQNGAIARVSAVNGVHWLRPDLPRAQDMGMGYFVTTVVDALMQNRPLQIWEADTINMFATPSLASESAEMILRIIERDKREIFHCCGGERIGRMALARRAAEVFGLDANLLCSGLPPAGQLGNGSIPYDTSLSATHTAAELDYQLPTITQMLDAYRLQRETQDLVTIY